MQNIFLNSDQRVNTQPIVDGDIPGLEVLSSKRKHVVQATRSKTVSHTPPVVIASAPASRFQSCLVPFLLSFSDLPGHGSVSQTLPPQVALVIVFSLKNKAPNYDRYILSTWIISFVHKWVFYLVPYYFNSTSMNIISTIWVFILHHLKTEDTHEWIKISKKLIRWLSYYWSWIPFGHKIKSYPTRHDSSLLTSPFVIPIYLLSVEAEGLSFIAIFIFKYTILDFCFLGIQIQF